MPSPPWAYSRDGDDYTAEVYRMRTYPQYQRRGYDHISEIASHSEVILIERKDEHMNDQDKLMYTVAITEVINRYFAALDQKQFDITTMSQIFADDAKVQRPNRSHSLSRFQATQHLTSGFIITLKDDTSAEFRANVVAMHLWAEGEGDPSADPNDNYFLAGLVITGQVTLGADGWRITEIIGQATWRRGTGFQEMLKTK